MTVSIASVPTKLITNTYETIRGVAEWEKAERRLNTRPPRTIDELKNTWRGNARKHVDWITDPHHNDSAARLYLQSLRILESLDTEPDSLVFGHGKEIFEAYASEFLAGLKQIGREILSPMPGFGESR